MSTMIWGRSSMGLILAGLVAAGTIGCDEGAGTGSSGGGGGAGGSTNAGGSTSAGGSTGGTSGTTSMTNPGKTSMIDDMEDADGSILAVEGRVGAWYTYNDESAAGTQTPTVGDPFAMAPLNPPRGSSTFAANTKGSGFTTWGSGFGFDFNNAGVAKAAYDASKFSGVTFWAKIGAGTTGVVRVNFGDKNTTPEGGVCDAAGGKCSDDFGAGITLTEDWQQFTLKFADQAQVGWSMVVLPKLDTSALYSMHFQTGAMSKFDIWIDDLAFVE